MSIAQCDHVSDLCPVENSIYGYQPNLAGNAIFLALFAVSAAAHTFQGIRYKTWTFLIAMAIGCVLEAGGQVGRVLLNNNVYSEAGFNLQIILLTIAPAFLAAGIYLTLKHLVITFGEHLSRLRPAHYTYIFIGCDFFSLVLQGAGGGIAATADDNRNMLEVGDNLMIAGLAFQVFTLIVFAVLALDFFLKVWKNKNELNPSTNELRSSLKFKLFLGALFISYITILVRCIYRVIEMAGGWGNSIMQNETIFMILDSLMIVIAVSVMNFFHPGRFLQSMANPWKSKSKEMADEGFTSGSQE